MSDIYMLRRCDLNSFITDHVQANTVFLDCCKEVIDTLVRHLQRASGKLTPKHILKSGSLGKGTAVNGRADIDLVVMLNEYKDVDGLMSEMSGVLKKLLSHVLERKDVKHQKTTRFSVQIQITCSAGHSHDVDILPSVHLPATSDAALVATFEKMKNASSTNIHEYSVSLAPIQLEIIGSLPPKVKCLIQLIKYWKNEKLKGRNEPEMSSFAEKIVGRTSWPSSYVLELIIINAWNNAGNPENFDMTMALHTVLTSLVNHSNFKVILRKQMKYSEAYLAPNTKLPYIMDPANPFNDMYHGLVDGKAFDWEAVKPKAQQWLSQPLFSGISASKQWK